MALKNYYLTAGIIFTRGIHYYYKYVSHFPIKIFQELFLLLYAYKVLPTCIYVLHVHAWYPWRT